MPNTDNITVIVTPQSTYTVEVTDALAIKNVLPPTRFVDNAVSAVTASYALIAEAAAGVYQSASFAITSSYLNAGSSYIGGVLYSGSVNIDVDSGGTETVALIGTSSYDAAFFDYLVKSGSNYRAGSVVTVWDGTNVEHTDISTNDIGNTSGVVFDVDFYSGSARLSVTAITNDWTIKTAIRTL
jgi:hypothetical protein